MSFNHIHRTCKKEVAQRNCMSAFFAPVPTALYMQTAESDPNIEVCLQWLVSCFNHENDEVLECDDIFPEFVQLFIRLPITNGFSPFLLRSIQQQIMETSSLNRFRFKSNQILFSVHVSDRFIDLSNQANFSVVALELFYKCHIQIEFKR